MKKKAKKKTGKKAKAGATVETVEKAKEKITIAKAFEDIFSGAAVLGWTVSFRRDANEDAPVEYLILGTREETDRIVDILESHK